MTSVANFQYMFSSYRNDREKSRHVSLISVTPNDCMFSVTQNTFLHRHAHAYTTETLPAFANVAGKYYLVPRVTCAFVGHIIRFLLEIQGDQSPKCYWSPLTTNGLY